MSQHKVKSSRALSGDLAAHDRLAEALSPGGTTSLLVQMYCPKCSMIVGRLDVLGGIWWHREKVPDGGIREFLPTETPRVVAVVRLRSPADAGKGTPMVEWGRVLINHRHDPDVERCAKDVGAPALPAVLPAECPVHGVTPFKTKDAAAYAAKEWLKTLRRMTPDTPEVNAGRWKLKPVL